MSKKFTTEQFIKKANKIHNNYYDYSLVDYQGMKTKVKIICPKHGIFEQTPDNHTASKSARGCPICGRKRCGESKSKNSHSTQEFIEKSLQKYSNHFDYSKAEYTRFHDKILLKCKKTNFWFSQSYANHFNFGCPKCAGKLTNTEFIEIAKRIHHNYYDYSLVCFKATKEKVKIICPKHGVFEQNFDNHLSGHGCQKCKSSNSEKVIQDYLSKNNIEFISQKKFNDCKDKRSLPFDFYIPSKNILLEYNGEQHYRSINYFGGREKFLLQKHHDWLKRNYAKKNGYDFVVIKYNENLQEKLSDLFGNVYKKFND